VKKVFLVFGIIIVLFSGCESDKTTTGDSRNRRIELYTKALSDYLRDANSPELKSVQQWENDYGPGLKLTTAHYEIFATLVEPEMLCKVPQFMEAAYKAYNSQLPNPVEISTKLTVYLFAQRAQWEHFTGLFAGEYAETFNKIQAGAYYHNGACVAYDIGQERTFFALGHEGWHQFTGRVFKYRLPSWLDEGSAMLFEAYVSVKGKISFEPAANSNRLDALKKTLANGSLMPLKELIAINPGQVLSTDKTQAAMAFYSQSYALVRFLRESGNGKRLGVYRRLLADGMEGKWPLDAASMEVAIDRNMPRTILWNHIVGTMLFQEYIGTDFDAIEKEYLEFCNRLVR
jgi:hypothetical protein